MLESVLKMLVAGLAFANTAAAVDTPQHAVYFENGQYSASLAQGEHRWRLQPLTGDVVDVIDRTCVNDLRLPHGVWLVTRDAADRLQLVAPSTTVLPSGFPAQLRLAACSSGEERGALAVPDIVFAWLAGNSGSVMIDE